MGSRRYRSALALCLIFLAATLALAAPVVLDADKARDVAKQAGRQGVEGIWAVPQKWDPDPKQARDYRVAIVANNHGVFKDAKYLGIVLCNKEGVTRGEVKLLLSPTKKKDEFQATWRTNKGDVKGKVALISNSLGEPYAAIDTSTLKWKGHVLVAALVRIKEEK